jgi:hypothetical protein
MGKRSRYHRRESSEFFLLDSFRFEGFLLLVRGVQIASSLLRFAEYYTPNASPNCDVLFDKKATAMGIDTEDYRCVGAPDHSQKGINR